MAGYQKIASLFHEGIDKMKTLRGLVDYLMPQNNVRDHELQDQLDAQRQANETLERDLISLKQKVASLSRMPDQVSDTKLEEQMDDIWQQVTAWVRTNFRQSKTAPTYFEVMPALSESSMILLGDYSRIILGTTKYELLKVVGAVIGREMTSIFGDFYFGIESDESSGNVLHLADVFKGNSTLLRPS